MGQITLDRPEGSPGKKTASYTVVYFDFSLAVLTLDIYEMWYLNLNIHNFLKCLN